MPPFSHWGLTLRRGYIYYKKTGMLAKNTETKISEIVVPLQLG